MSFIRDEDPGTVIASYAVVAVAALAWFLLR